MKTTTFKLHLLLMLALPLAENFDWRKSTVYFVITDRFANGDPANDVNYGRIVDYGSERMNAATFHGGDFKGMLQKAREGWFADMGVDVVWMTDVYEQIHGWMYHRDADPENMADCGTTLLLTPGVAQIFYGDETGRKASAGPQMNVDSDQSFRSDMNWGNIDDAILRHYRKLGRIRRAHPAIGAGRQITIDNHTCAHSRQ